jgi:chorismate mutase
MMSEKEIKKVRQRINELDNKLLFLLNERAEQVIRMAELKQAMGLKIFDAKREKEIFVRVTDQNPGPLPPDSVVRLFERVIDESRRLERTAVYDKNKKES